MKQRIGILLVLALALMLAAAGCGRKSEEAASSDNEPRDGGTLTIAAEKDIYSLDPGRANDATSQRIMDQVFDKLVGTDENLNLIPAVAESWEPSEDGMEWTFHLREGIKFTDGTELTAEDVAYSFQRILDAPEAASQKRSKISMIERIEIVDSRTITFHLSIPYAPFLGAAGQHIVPKHVVEEMGEDQFGRRPIGSGPFMVEEWIPDDHVTIVRNEDYWGGRPHLDKVIFKPIPDGTVAAMSVISGEVDVVAELQGPMIEKVKEAGIDVKIVDGMSYFWIGFRQTAAPYTDVRFRQMVYASTDVDQTIATVLENGTGTRSYTPVPAGLWPRDLDHMKSVAIKQDKERAKELFDELVADGVMTKDTPVVFHVNEDSIRTKIGEIFVTNLKGIGVNAQLKVSEWSAYLDAVIRTQEPCMYMLGTTAAILDPDAVFNWLFSSESNQGGNILALKKSEIDDMLLEARTSTDRERREEIYREIQKWAIEDNVFHIPAYNKNAVMAVNKRVHEMQVAPNNDLWLMTSFANVWVEGAD